MSCSRVRGGAPAKNRFLVLSRRHGMPLFEMFQSISDLFADFFFGGGEGRRRYFFFYSLLYTTAQKVERRREFSNALQEYVCVKTKLVNFRNPNSFKNVGVLTCINDCFVCRTESDCIRRYVQFVVSN